MRGIGEKFAANPVTGTGSTSVPIYVSPGRSGFGPQLSLSYDSGSGNGVFGVGWSLSLPSITRKTDKGIPQYRDDEESDVFILSGSEDLVPVLVLKSSGEWQRDPVARTVEGANYSVQSYRPRIDGLFARIERWTNVKTGEIHWRSITKDNITTIYGKNDNSRIIDPTDVSVDHRIFSWLISESYDDKGNAIVYEYKAENSQGVDLAQTCERNRTDSGRAANRYLKRIKYGNRVSRLIEPDLPEDQWIFEVVFDYGEHDSQAPKPDDAGAWLCRNDPFSVYRAGFEVRTYRLCQRVLMFHHFPDEAEVGTDCLVHSTDFVYRNTRNNPDDLKRGHPVASFIHSITQSGYKRAANRYLKKSMPALEFEYSQSLIQENIREVDVESLENLPNGLADSIYQWVDLDGEGLSGILTRQANGWFYKRNLSPISIQHDNGKETVSARFAPVEVVAAQPSLSAGQQQLLDLAGDGQVDLVQFDRPLSGYYERTQHGDWSQFAPFRSTPDIAWDDSNVKFVDLTGDGHADVLVSEESVFTWYPSLAEEGFGAAERVCQALDEEKGPRLVFADGTESIYLADMSGDGLTDLVRVRNSEVCYWPNLGYGRFGARVSMDHAPLLDRPELFDQRRVRLADIDGSGVTDILYLGSNGIRIYFNQSGNSWDKANTLSRFPQVDDLASVAAIDLLGNGTACLVWSSSLSGDARRPMRYIDLMGQKPHLLVKTVNNLGAETIVRYAPSTRFYLEDKQSGKPWITRLPFPVHCVERVETYDRVSGNRFVSRYKYHHGYFDGTEREFRGFGMVEQWDTEEIGSVPDDENSSAATNLDAASFVPPIHTKTWFHTGVYLGRDHVSNYFAGLIDAQDVGEYYREPGWKDEDEDEEAKKSLLDDTALPQGLTTDEERDACRALKGAMLRQEVYGLDGTDKAQHPYTVTEQNFSIESLQPQGVNSHAVFFTHGRETLSYQYERNPDNPRVGHSMTLEVDKYGNVMKSVAIGYGRESSPMAEQTRTLIIYTENSVTNAIDDADHPDDYRAPWPSEVRTYELHADPDTEGYMPTGDNGLFRFGDFVEKAGAELKLIEPGPEFGNAEIEYEESLTEGKTRRLVECVRTLYRSDDLSGPLPLGKLQPLALPGQTYKLAFTPGLLTKVYKRKLGAAPEMNLLPDPAQVLGGKDSDQGGYQSSQQLRAQAVFPADEQKPLWTLSDADGHWWIPSGRIFYSTTADIDDPAATAAAELAEAQQHFFLPREFTDPFDPTTTVDYDTYDLVVVKTEDVLLNAMTALYDYRVLQPVRITDANGNQSEVRFDALGMVVGTAVMGKDTGPVEGDSFDTFTTDLTLQEIQDYIDAANPHVLAVNHLGTATTRIIYDLDRIPPCAAFIERETHVSDLDSGAQTKVQLSFAYSDGLGREAQTKIQAEPGPLDPDGPVLNPRWVGTGAKIYNNKGKPVRQYEPFFSATHHCGIEQHGVSSTLFYDAAERVVATLHPNHTWEKVVFDPWEQTSYDANDTVLNPDGSTDPKLDEDVKGFFSRLSDADYLPTWYEERSSLAPNHPERVAADKVSIHRQTPTVIHLDTLGRAFLTIAHNRFERNGDILEEEYPTRVALDIEGNQREVRDAVVQNDPLGRVVMRYEYDMLGNRIRQASMEAGERWMLNDAHGNPIRAWDSKELDRRITYDALRRPTGMLVIESGVERLAERTVYGESQGATDNHRTRVFQVFDSAGVVTSEAYDFKGNLLSTRRDLLPDYKGNVNWQLNPNANDATFTSSTTFDALNRATSVTAPDNSIYRPTYNEANLLDKVEVNLRGENVNGDPLWTPFVTNIDYNAKGQRTLIHYANGAQTTYEYDDKTFRLIHLKTTRLPGQNGLASQIFINATTIQDLHYTYDPAGNITRIADDALPVVVHDNQQVAPISNYTYDAIYRLIKASGREHIDQTAFDFSGNFRDYPFAGLGANPNDLQALRNYTERYEYDAVGNFQKLIHQAGTSGNWTREYAYNETSLTEPTKQNNRLSSTSIGQTVENYSHDAHGNIISMPHLTLMEWNFKDELRATSRQAVNSGTPETTFYVYDESGQRVRKVTERQNGSRKNERIYLDGFEIYREYNGNGTTVTLERETLHVMDEDQRIALVETKIVENSNPISTPASLQRYQLGNHLGSSSLELDKEGGLVSYEEYHPYGTTAYQALNTAAEISLKRYRYTGRERDDESGLSYHSARYYAEWLGRWTAADPAGLVDGLNLYGYSRNNPVMLVDHTGHGSQPSSRLQRWAQILIILGKLGKSDPTGDPEHEGKFAKPPPELSEAEKDKEGIERDPKKKRLGGGGSPPKKPPMPTPREAGKQPRPGGPPKTEGPPKASGPPKVDAPTGAGKVGKAAKAGAEAGEGLTKKISDLVGKKAKKFLPGVGSAFGVYQGIENFREGKFLEGLLDLGGAIPGPVGDVFDVIGIGYSVGKLVVEEMDQQKKSVPEARPGIGGVVEAIKEGLEKSTAPAPKKEAPRAPAKPRLRPPVQRPETPLVPQLRFSDLPIS